MTIEQSHGKARPTLPRSSDLPQLTEPERSRNRDDRGRAVLGNDLARGKGWKASLRKMLGRQATDEVVLAVAEDAWRLLCAFLRELPSSGANVRALVTSRARHVALEAFYGARAAAAGYDTAEGQAYDELATKHGQRAERLAVTSLDVSERLQRAKPDPADAFWLKEDPK